MAKEASRKPALGRVLVVRSDGEISDRTDYRSRR
jgi:hypothetical protein